MDRPNAVRQRPSNKLAATRHRDKRTFNLYYVRLMYLFRAKQILLAMLLMTSLLTAAPAACLCSSHEDPPAAEEKECQSHSGTHGGSLEVDTDTLSGHACVCVTAPRTPCVASKNENREVKFKNATAYCEEISAEFAFTPASAIRHGSSPARVKRVPASTLASLLPSRAPPRA